MFSPNIGDACEDHGERFPIDITPLENCYNGRLASFSLPDYGWSLRREMDIQKKHQSRHQRYFLKKIKMKLIIFTLLICFELLVHIVPIDLKANNANLRLKQHLFNLS